MESEYLLKYIDRFNDSYFQECLFVHYSPKIAKSIISDIESNQLNMERADYYCEKWSLKEIIFLTIEDNSIEETNNMEDDWYYATRSLMYYQNDLNGAKTYWIKQEGETYPNRFYKDAIKAESDFWDE